MSNNQKKKRGSIRILNTIIVMLSLVIWGMAFSVFLLYFWGISPQNEVIRYQRSWTPPEGEIFSEGNDNAVVEET